MNLRIVLSSWSVTLWHDKIFLWKSRLKKNYLECDNLVFQFSKKCFDQTGNNDDRWCYAYVGPNKPTNFPILSFSIYLFENLGVMINKLEVTQEERGVHK